jgi:hypothetical protein
VAFGAPIGGKLGTATPAFKRAGGLTLTSPHHYEIRVAGTLPPEALLDFEQLDAYVEPVGTMVHGVISDQAALYGLLTRLEALGAQVLEVRRLHTQAPPAQRAGEPGDG